MDNLKNRIKNRKGFTLVELLVVIAIIAILSVTAYVALGGQTGKARDSRRQSDLSAVQSALEIFFINNSNKYPDALAELEAKEMPSIPTDPWGDAVDYDYAVDGPGNKTYQLAATLEDDDGDLAAYVIGNGDGLLTGMGLLEADCSTVCEVTDGSDTCVPYCQP